MRSPARRLCRALAVSLVTVAAVPGVAHADCAGANIVPTRATAKQAQAAVLCLLNVQRAAHGLRPLHDNRTLHKAAKKFSLSMRVRHFFDHTSPSGSTPLERVRAAGYLKHASRFEVGENIGWGGGSLGTPAAMVDAWMHSAGHRANILRGSFRDIGIGIVAGDPQGGDGVTYTTDFGVRG